MAEVICGRREIREGGRVTMKVKIKAKKYKYF